MTALPKNMDSVVPLDDVTKSPVQESPQLVVSSSGSSPLYQTASLASEPSRTGESPQH